MTHRIALSAALFIGLFAVGCSQSAYRTVSAEHSHTSGTRSININTATVEELQSVPFIGERTAVAIVEFRKANGPFRRPQHLMQVRGISDKRFREIRHLIRTE
jgi:competence protein ComEA